MGRLTRDIVTIDEDKCDGCGACVPSCAEGAIQIIDGKARLIADNLCDGLGNCLGTCPKGAITVEQRPAEEFDESAVEAHLHSDCCSGKTTDSLSASDTAPPLPCGCPGSMMKQLSPSPDQADAPATGRGSSQLGHWPVQLSLLPAGGNMWQDAHVLIAADCVGFAMPDFHERLLAGKTLAVACPKLDETEPYVEKLAAVFSGGGVKSVTVARMEVPCCGGLTQIVHEALTKAGVEIPVTTVVVSAEGRIISVNGLSVA